MSANDEMICVAAIAGAFGVKGEVKIKSFTDVPSDCMAYSPFMDEAGQIILTVRAWKEAGRFFAAFTDEVITREAAEALKSTKLYVPKGDLPDTDEDEFYYHALIGLSVKTQSGQNAGEVLGVHEFGAGDMLEIRPPKDKKTGKQPASYFHPFTKAAVPKVDMKAGRIIIVPQIADEVPKEYQGETYDT